MLLSNEDPLSPESGAMGTMLAQIIRVVGNDGAFGHANALYKNAYTSKNDTHRLGLGFEATIRETGMAWLKASMFDWAKLQFRASIQDQICFFIPDSQYTYRERRSQVNNVTRLHHGVTEISKTLKKDGSIHDEHRLDRIRRICFLALTMEVLKYNRTKQTSAPPRDL